MADSYQAGEGLHQSSYTVQQAMGKYCTTLCVRGTIVGSSWCAMAVAGRRSHPQDQWMKISGALRALASCHRVVGSRTHYKYRAPEPHSHCATRASKSSMPTISLFLSRTPSLHSSHDGRWCQQHAGNGVEIGAFISCGRNTLKATRRD